MSGNSRAKLLVALALQKESELKKQQELNDIEKSGDVNDSVFMSNPSREINSETPVVLVDDFLQELDRETSTNNNEDCSSLELARAYEGFVAGFGPEDEFDFFPSSMIIGPEDNEQCSKTTSTTVERAESESLNTATYIESNYYTISEIVADTDVGKECSKNTEFNDVSGENITDSANRSEVPTTMDATIPEDRHVRLRKRKKISQVNKVDISKKRKISKHPLLEACTNCRKSCTNKFSQALREKIHDDYWKLSDQEQKLFVLSVCARIKKKSQTSDSETNPRNYTFIYRLKNENGLQEVCKIFFLTTLGYKKKNDSVVFRVLHGSHENIPVPNLRGKDPNPNKIDRTILKAHVESFNPEISHYRREHAPNVRYLPSDITITAMFDDFKEKNPNTKCSYELYRRTVAEMNIHFTKLGHEECEKCYLQKMHNSSSTGDCGTANCESCSSWGEHIKRATKSRERYQHFAGMKFDEKTVCFSSDMQKVIMLPRMDFFKSVIFSKRLSLYNQTFVPVGGLKKHAPVAIIWHAGISGRDKEDVISAFKEFFSTQRDKDHIILWLDNCSAQNKNWALFSFFMNVVNSSRISANKITVFYFEPGHTFMSCDSFHHKIELSMKHKKCIYDLSDFVNAVLEAAKSRSTIVKTMEANDFVRFEDHTSLSKRKNTKLKNPNQLLMKDIVQLEVRRRHFSLFVKNDYDDTDFLEYDVLKAKILKESRFPEPAPLACPKGVSAAILKDMMNLTKLMPETRRPFWEKLQLEEQPTGQQDTKGRKKRNKKLKK